MSRIPEGPVDHDVPMDPNTEELIYGDELQNGMVVLLRVVYNPYEKGTPEYQELLERLRHWVEVTKLRLLPSGRFQFIGVRADRTGQVVFASEGQGWLVKKSSPADS